MKIIEGVNLQKSGKVAWMFNSKATLLVFKSEEKSYFYFLEVWLLTFVMETGKGNFFVHSRATRREVWGLQNY